MNSLVDKVASILPALELHGTVYLFALAEREDSAWWDVVLSSEWSDKDRTGAIGIVIDLLWPRLELEERMMIAKVVVVPSHNARMQEMPASLDGVTPEDKKVVYVTLLGSDVKQAFIFTARHAPPIALVAPQINAGAVHA